MSGTMLARTLNPAGVAAFRRHLRRLREGAVEAPPLDLLEDPAHTDELPVEIEVGDHAFPSRLALGAHLGALLEPLPPEELERNPGLWAWLSLRWFERVCPARVDGTRRPGRDNRHLPEFGYRDRYRHLLYGPYLVYRRHGKCALVLLSGPVNVESHLYQVITGRQDLIANRGVIEAALRLYVDPRSGSLKRGCQPARPRPGTVRRFARVLQQLDLTYDVYGMRGDEILELLPPEFDAWRDGH